MFIFIGIIVSVVAEGLGLAIGATFNVTVSFFIVFFFSLK